MTINQIQEEIISDLEDLEMVEKYEYLINLGKLLPVNENEKTDKNKIAGCQSRTWVFEIPQNVTQSLQTQNTILAKEKFSNLQNTKNLPKLFNSSDFSTKIKFQTKNSKIGLEDLETTNQIINQNIISKVQNQRSFQILAKNGQQKQNTKEENIEKNIKFQTQLQFAEEKMVNNLQNQQFSQNNSKNLSQTLSQNLEQKLFFGGFSDSQIVGGLLGLLWKIFDGQTKGEILNSNLFLLSKIGFDELLTVRRREGFWQIHHKIIQMCKT